MDKDDEKMKKMGHIALEELRSNLKKTSFFDRHETPLFSVYAQNLDMSVLSDAKKFHFVDGDGDFEFL